MKLKLYLRTEIKIIIILVSLSCLVAFGDYRQNNSICNDIVIELENEYDNHFIGRSDILNIIKKNRKNIIGQRFNQIDLRTIENNLQNNKYIFDAQLYGNLKGTLVANITLRTPIARLLCGNKPDVYIAKDGTLLPLSTTFLSRTLLVSGSIVKQLTPLENSYQTTRGTRLMEVLCHIHENQFWKAQVAQLDFNESKMVIYSQVTNQLVEFGELVDIKTKFQKLMIFYKKILPQKGWMKYSRVNVEYDNQIIAE